MTDDQTEPQNEKSDASTVLPRHSTWWRRWSKRAALAVATALLTLFIVRIYDTQSGPPLDRWHTVIPKELPRTAMAKSDWSAWLAAEENAMRTVRTDVTEALPPERRVISNRFHEDSPMYPPRFERDWNRSYLDMPEGDPIGAVVLLHGLTDSPYSLRHVGRRYRERGFVVVGIRLPGHGTVPAGLTDVVWEDWAEATRLAARAAIAHAGDEVPLHIVGFSLGGALAMKYTLDSLENELLRTPDRVVLISPMVGITRFAKFAGLAGLPAVFPAFAKAAWLGILPEFNPFKYNSFPVNGARQAHRLSTSLQRQIHRLASEGRLAGLPPITTFQSVMDFTVSTPAVVRSLYAFLPENGSELVLFDINRSIKFDELMRPGARHTVERLVPPPPQRYGLVVIGSADGADGLLGAAVERITPAGAIDSTVRPLEWPYPPQFFSLSHVALPFPLDDALYGVDPTPDEDFGVRLGSLNVRGERGALLVPLDAIFRVASNPFFEYVLERFDEVIADPSPERSTLRHAPVPAVQPSRLEEPWYVDADEMPHAGP